MSEKPVIFISHSSKDEVLANSIGQQIERVFDNQVRAFVAHFSIAPGQEWFNEILSKLNSAQALIVIVSSSSTNSRWVGIEIGYLWTRIVNQKLSVYPLCVGSTSVFSPLDNKQGISLNNPEEVKRFLGLLCAEFNNGDAEKADVASIVQSAKDAAVESIKQTLIDRLDYEYKPGEEIVYTRWDRELNLPKGSTERYLPDLVQNWTVDETKRYSGGTALYPPISPSNPPNDPF